EERGSDLECIRRCKRHCSTRDCVIAIVRVARQGTCLIVLPVNPASIPPEPRTDPVAELVIRQRPACSGSCLITRLPVDCLGQFGTRVDRKLTEIRLGADEAHGPGFRAGPEQRALWSA